MKLSKFNVVFSLALIASAICAHAQSAPALINMSILTTIDHRNHAATTGFVLSPRVGTAQQKIKLLIRAIGPSLARFGIGGLATGISLTVTGLNPGQAQPTVDATLSANPAAIVAAENAVGAFPRTDATGDAVVIIEANAGDGITVMAATDTDADGGQAIIEVYQLPQ